MERFDIRGTEWRIQPRQDGLGAFTWAEEALAYRRSFWSSFFVNVMMVVVCALLSAYLVFHKHDPQPIAKPEISAEEYRQAIQLAERKEAEKLLLQAKLVGEQSRRILSDNMIKTLNANNAKLVKQLEALQVSVPTQPIILEAIRKEAATDQGLRKVVARNFGGEIAARIKVVNQ